MQIGIISGRFWPYCDFPESEAADVAQALTSEGHSVEVLTIHWQKNWPRTFQLREFNVVRFGRRRGGPWGMFRYLRELIAYIQHAQFDLLIVYDLTSESWGAIRSLAATMPVCLRINQSGWESFLTRRISYRQHKSLNQLQKILVDTPETREALIRNQIRPERITVLGPCIRYPHSFVKSLDQQTRIRSSLSDAHPILTIDSGQPLVVCGTDLADEGVPQLIDGWRRVLTQVPRAMLWLLGDGDPARGIWNRIRELDLSSSIIMPGYFDVLDDVLIAADVYVHAGVRGTACNRFAQAMACETCTVAISNPFVMRWIEHRKNGLLVPPSDPQTLAETMIAALQNSELRAILGASARATAKPFQVEHAIEHFMGDLTQQR